MKRVLAVFGTRPEAVKMAPVILALRERAREFDCKVVVTAQHRDMLDQVLALFDLRCDHDLNIMTDGQTLTDVNARALRGLEPILKREAPDLVLVHGDTTTTLAAAVAAFYQKIPVGHVEAGLRTHDLMNPYPEEFNRRAADAVSTLHFAPTPLSKRNLIRERVPAGGIFITGNTGIDALRLVVARMRAGRLPKPPVTLQRLAERPFILVTAHRRENFGEPLADVCRAIRKIALERTALHFVYPVHPNPNVLRPVGEHLSSLPNVHLLEPLDYADLIFLMRKAVIVLTDSGGLQEEAPALGKPVLVLRQVTERPEAVRAGTVRLVGTDPGAIRRWVARLLDDKACYRRMANAVNPYGDGRAADRTVEAIRHYFRLRRTPPAEFRVAS
jgi:UDP-N-acetylglucosamine 2-epimerase (non-hydrolysing)